MGSAQPPHLTVSPENSLSFDNVTQGLTDTKTVQVSNKGDQVLNWTAQTDGQGWLTIINNGGTIDAGDSAEIVVIAKTSGLEAGKTYAAILTISAPGVGEPPTMIGIGLSVVAPPPNWVARVLTALLIATIMFGVATGIIIIGYLSNWPSFRAQGILGVILFIVLLVLVIVELYLNLLLRASLVRGTTGPDLDLWRLILSYLLVGGGIGVVTLLAFNINSNNQAFMTTGISAIVGLVGFLVGHTSANVGRERSEQRLVDASKR